MRSKPASILLSLIFLTVLLLSFSSNSIAQNLKPGNLPPASATEDWSNQPPVVIPAENGTGAPSDAIILLGSETGFENWEKLDGTPISWSIKDNVMTIVPKTGDIQTKLRFGNVQLHLEWKTPDPAEDTGTNRGNSGVFLMALYELQIYESYQYQTRLYYNGMAGSIYKQHAPLVNAARKPQTWQTFDIVFEAPVFNPDKTLKTPAYMTVFQNNVLILNHVELKGPMVYQGYPRYEFHATKLPLRLQEHSSRVSFRNIWIREL
ncbi:endo-1,3-1,4-beta glucanase-related protein [Persicitalea jodogahamensis]|uniref:Endo-1,3-1,4-beta glucanase-related protein n=1 Tax=Persicitalea jodogahamensis TaxID=402147 RepID=A0A8J3D7E4_9BACT|nr:endo-1,3-1,4-beta glucanase-related protein [Persicitalea jodogahamensis]